MTGIVLEQFAGIAPVVHPTKLNDSLGTVAENVRFERTALTPERGIRDEGSVPAGTKSIYPYNNGWLTSPYRRQYVGSLLPNDTRERIFYTDADYPKIRSGSQEYRLGLPRPAAPTLEVLEVGDLSDLTKMRMQTYKVCWVDAWGAEGPPSMVPIPVEVGEGAVVRVSLPSVPTGNYNFGPGALIRIYRSNTGSENSYFQWAADVQIGMGHWDDNLEPGDLQEAIPSDDWIGPPDDNKSLYPDGPLKSLVELPGGVLAGHSGNTIRFSEPYLPHAWPLAYQIASETRPVAMAVIQGGLFVATEGQPYLIVGSSPAAMVRVPIESNEACVSAESMVDLGAVAMYASPRGLVMAQGNSAELVTEQFFDAETWQQFKPETIRAMAWRGKYLAFYGDVQDGTGFIFDPAAGTQSLTTFTAKVDGGYVDPETGEAFVVYRDSQNRTRVGVFGEGAPMTLRWRSKHFVMPSEVAFSVMRVQADSYPVTVRVVADGVERAVIPVPDSRPIRLPSGFMGKIWEFEFIADDTISRFGVWDSMNEVT